MSVRGLSRRGALLLAAWGALSLALPAAAQEALERLVITTAGGKAHAFMVEVMRNDQERARGLMFRRSMPADRGMLFDFKREENVSMWMQNTYIPLDMLFIRKDGTIHRIAENTEPLSTATIPSGGPVYSVLEINGGESARRGIKAGDRVSHAIFGNK
ncbi:MAG: DUF192 domain-containing protein [Beijerinckiaceae bacterium]